MPSCHQGWPRVRPPTSRTRSAGGCSSSPLVDCCDDIRPSGITNNQQGTGREPRLNVPQPAELAIMCVVGIPEEDTNIPALHLR
jgi:hypothetical protein